MSMSCIERLAVQVSGPGPMTLVLGHGFGGDQRVWDAVLASGGWASGLRVVRFDHAGCGRSMPGSWSLDRHARLEGYRDDLLELLDALGPEPVVYVGHSFGASVGLLAAVAQPARFRHLVLLCCSPCMLDDEGYRGGWARFDILELLTLMDDNRAAWADLLAPLAIAAPGRTELVDRMRQSLCHGDPVVLHHLARLAFLSDIRDRTGRVRVPCTVVDTDGDAFVPPEVGAWLNANLPQSLHRRIKGSGHCPHLSHPEETARLLQQVIANVGVSPAG